MDTRTFTIVDTETQQVKEITSSATTLGELKRDLRQYGFNVNGKLIQEALTKIEFIDDDDARLPHDVSYKGTVTNDLVFRITNAEKKIKSGVDRKWIYNKIKERGLENEIKAQYGKNYTVLSNELLLPFVCEATDSSETCTCTVEESGLEDEIKVEFGKNYFSKNSTTSNDTPVNPIENLVNLLVCYGYLKTEDKDRIFNGCISEDSCKNSGKYSKKELDDLLSALN